LYLEQKVFHSGIVTYIVFGVVGNWRHDHDVADRLLKWGYIQTSINDNILSMTLRRNIALVAGTITTLAAFSAGMALLILGGYFADNEVIIYASIALGPMAMVSVIVGYAVWWLVLFLLTLALSDHKPVDGPQ
jgi:hypothetical protein